MRPFTIDANGIVTIDYRYQGSQLEKRGGVHACVQGDTIDLMFPKRFNEWLPTLFGPTTQELTRGAFPSRNMPDALRLTIANQWGDSRTLYIPARDVNVMPEVLPGGAPFHLWLWSFVDGKAEHHATIWTPLKRAEKIGEKVA